MAARFKEIMKKYGKVAAGVHLSVSAVSITGLYIAIRNNIDVESVLEKWHLPGVGTSSAAKDAENPVRNPTQDDVFNSSSSSPPPRDEFLIDDEFKLTAVTEERKRNRTAELAASTGGALALAVLCNKALLPIRVPITIALTPPISRFLARRRIIKM